MEKRIVALADAQLSQTEFLLGETDLARKDAQTALATADDQIARHDGRDGAGASWRQQPRSSST